MNFLIIIIIVFTLIDSCKISKVDFCQSGHFTYYYKTMLDYFSLKCFEISIFIILLGCHQLRVNKHREDITIWPIIMKHTHLSLTTV